MAITLRKHGLEKQAATNARTPVTVPVRLTPGMTARPTLALVPDDPAPKIPVADRPAPSIPRLDPARAARTVRWTILRAAYEARFAHLHGWQLLVWWAKGTWRGWNQFWAWALSAEYRRLAELHSDKGNAHETSVMLKATADNRKHRLPKAVGLAAFVVALAAALFAPGRPELPIPLALRLGILALWGICAVPTGRRLGGKLVDLPDDTGPVTRDQIGQAFADAGIPGVQTLGAPQYDKGRCTIHVVLPGGKTTDEALAARNRVASSLGKHRDCVYVTPGRVENHVTVTIADHDPLAAQPPTSPLEKHHRWSVWDKGIPFGCDAEGHPVTLPLTRDGELLGYNVLVVGRMRTGKSFAIMDITVPFVADPAARTWVFEFKGDNPYGPVQPHCDRFITSARIGIPAAAAQALTALEELKRIVERRQWALADMDEDENPKAKVTERLAKTDPRFHPMLVVLDEYPNALEECPALSDLLHWLLRNAPSVAVTFVLGSQRVQQESLQGIRGYLPIRYVLSVAETRDSSTVLGADHVKGVTDASTLGDRTGVGYLQGVGATRLVQTYRVDRRLLREVAGRTTPIPAGHTPSTVSLTKTETPLPVLVAALYETGEDWLPSATIATRVGTGWDARRVGRELRTDGVPVEERDWVDNGRPRRTAGVYRRHLPQ